MERPVMFMLFSKHTGLDSPVDAKIMENEIRQNNSSK